MLADYRGYIVEKEIEKIATSYFSQSLKGDEVDIAVHEFMEEKFNKNADKKSYGAQNASLAKHDQSERAVNLAFQEKSHEHKNQLVAKDDHSNHHTANRENHTHIGYVKDMSVSGGIYKTILGPKSDKGTKIIAESAQRRLDAFSAWSLEEAENNVLDIQLSGNVTNRTVDDMTILFLNDGDITSQYNEKSDRIDVQLNGKPFAKITWEDAERQKEKIDPARIMVGQINHDGVGYAKMASDIDPELSYERRAAAGINPITDMVEHTVLLSTQCKELYLKADKDNDTYATLLRDAGIHEELNTLAMHYNYELGTNMDAYIDRIKSQYVDSTSNIYDPSAVMDEHLIAYEISENYPELGVDKAQNGSGSVFDRLASLHKKEKTTQHVAVDRDTAPYVDFLKPN